MKVRALALRGVALTPSTALGDRAFPRQSPLRDPPQIAEYPIRCILGYNRSLETGPMVDQSQARSTQFSRRTLLRGAVRAAGAAAILGPTANRAMAKISQAAVA